MLDFRKLWNAAEPSVGEISKIAREVKKIDRRQIAAVRLGGMTDCFQPIEKLHRVTYKTIKLLNKRRIPYLIVTKSAMVADPEYLAVLDKELAHIQITVTTLNDKLCATYEKASPPSERIKAIKTLQAMGFDVQLRLSPFIPEYMDIDKLNGLGINNVCIEFLRVNNWIKRWFDIDYSPYTVKQSGYEHLPLEMKKRLISQINGFKEMTVCEDETEAFQYWKEHFNYNKDDCCNLRRTNEQSGKAFGGD